MIDALLKCTTFVHETVIKNASLRKYKAWGSVFLSF